MADLQSRRVLIARSRNGRRKIGLVLGFCALLAGVPATASAQENTAPSSSGSPSVAELARQISELRDLVEQLQAQVKQLQANAQAPAPPEAGTPPSPPAGQTSGAAAVPSPTTPRTAAVTAPASPAQSTATFATVTAPASPAQSTATFATVTAPASPAQSAAAYTTPAPTTTPAGMPAESQKITDALHGTTVNFLFDGYYAYNFNAPIGRDNLLRAYDVSSNAFSLNQGDVVLENAPDVANDKRWGARLDLQFGQATETLQGNAANEPRPEVYRNIFQAYGTYVAPIGTGLNIDFGKWASSLGFENNYTKDQMSYSRSFWFDFLPFYHEGARVHYQLNSVVGLNYWMVNGTEQTEPFNGYKDQFVGIVLQPSKKFSWTSQYYRGQEHPDFQYVTSGPPNLPTVQGMPFEPIPNPATGRLNILDNYATWNATSKLTLALEGDYVIERLYTTSAPQHTDGGAAYAQYQFTPKFDIAARSEYLSDRGGLFTGVTQAVKEGTLTFEYKFSDNFLMFEEWRRDWSNRPYFLTPTLFVLKNYQNTATIGLVWWFGGKSGPW
ncbi:MAG: outer membrane beta-barrel protein [Terriglobia bacterium]